MNTSMTLTHMAHNRTKRLGGHNPRAAALFDRAYRSPNPNRFERLLGRRVQPLSHLYNSATTRDVTHRHHAGTRAIAVDQIHGTLNRADDFDSDFHPLKESMKDRWCRVATAMLSGMDLPPIEVIQVGDEYFVKDGHHRISVARALGFRYLDAVVEVWASA